MSHFLKFVPIASLCTRPCESNRTREQVAINLSLVLIKQSARLSLSLYGQPWSCFLVSLPLSLSLRSPASCSVHSISSVFHHRFVHSLPLCISFHLSTWLHNQKTNADRQLHTHTHWWNYQSQVFRIQLEHVHLVVFKFCLFTEFMNEGKLKTCTRELRRTVISRI